MNNLRKSATALAAAAALSVGGVSLATSASAAKPVKTPCATQQTQADKAQAKLDWLTAKLAAEQAKVKKDKTDVADSHGAAKARAKKALRVAKADRARVAKAKKAQQQRVAHATARLQKCQAANPTPAPAPAPAPTA